LKKLFDREKIMNQKTRLVLASAIIVLLFNQKASACDGDPFIGSVCIMASNFCPKGFANADGQILSIAQNNALFALLGTQYGGDGVSTFALPDLRGRQAIGVGTGAGFSTITNGQQGGNETVTLTEAQLPAHTHTAQINATSANGDVDNPASAIPARMPRSRIYSSGTANTVMASSSITVNGGGGGQPTSVRDPFLGLQYCIALVGIFPSRN
jgi:microcystin-dependent protein